MPGRSAWHDTRYQPAVLRQVGQLDAIIVPISGGGMCSGVATVAKALQPGIRVIAAEPRGAAVLLKPAVTCLSN